MIRFLSVVMFLVCSGRLHPGDHVLFVRENEEVLPFVADRFEITLLFIVLQNPKTSRLPG